MQCPNSKPTKDAIIKAAYGGEYEVYARKVYLKSILREEHAPLIQRIATLSDFIRDVTFRAQLFVNYLSVENKERKSSSSRKATIDIIKDNQKLPQKKLRGDVLLHRHRHYNL
ncbi:hypothetical protein BCV71DRAFT_253107 [Rhizopus microsporus]|uniref:Uncharacterized protein n=1 Tax=Rhizopus microsporus TaxID=58291 RepID=A0A1X0SD72_RHIZD|nr:hypothetical protein BCV71DRAFT_253107 [Rhizopus microsporus]